MLSRRGLLIGLGSLLAAPAIVRAASIMPVRRPAIVMRRGLMMATGMKKIDPLFQDGDLIYDGIIIRPYSADFFRDSLG